MIPSSGVVVVTDSANHRIRLVTPLGVVTTLAGGCTQNRNGYCTGAFADGTGAAARFYQPSGVAVIPSSDVIVVADEGNNRIRLVTPLGVVTTLAGSGSAAFAEGTGTAASFWSPLGVAVIPSSGLVVVADTGNHRIRLVTPLGVVTTLAVSSSITSADGIGAAASFFSPIGVAVNPSNSIFVVTDIQIQRIRLITLSAVLSACDSTWHHVALTYSPSASPFMLSAFLDGLLAFASTTTIAQPSAASSSLRIGWSGDSISGSLFAGALSDLRIFARALSAVEIGLIVPCVSGSTWSTTGFLPCAACAACSSEGTLIAIPCTTSSNAICGCSTGYVASGGLNSCAKCLACSGVGQMVAFACTALINTVCGCASGYSVSSGGCIANPCAAGSTWGVLGVSPCTACAACSGVGQAIVSACTAGANAVCGCSKSNTYTYDGAACVPCAVNASFVSATAGCMPSALLQGPTDTAFYLSGSSAESVAALTISGALPTLWSDLCCCQSEWLIHVCLPCWIFHFWQWPRTSVRQCLANSNKQPDADTDRDTELDALANCNTKSDALAHTVAN